MHFFKGTNCTLYTIHSCSSRYSVHSSSSFVLCSHFSYTIHFGEQKRIEYEHNGAKITDEHWTLSIQVCTHHRHTPYAVRNKTAECHKQYSELCEMIWNYNLEKMFFLLLLSIMNIIQVVHDSLFFSSSSIFMYEDGWFWRRIKWKRNK